jgi:hypothetical protein
LAFLFAVHQIGEELFQERKHPKQGRHDENAAISILKIGQMADGMKQQAQRICESVPLPTLDFFSRIGSIEAPFFRRS